MRVIIVLIMLNMSVLNSKFLLVDVEEDGGKKIEERGLNLTTSGGRSLISGKKGYELRL